MTRISVHVKKLFWCLIRIAFAMHSNQIIDGMDTLICYPRGRDIPRCINVCADGFDECQYSTTRSMPDGADQQLKEGWATFNIWDYCIVSAGNRLVGSIVGCCLKLDINITTGIHRSIRFQLLEVRVQRVSHQHLAGAGRG